MNLLYNPIQNLVFIIYILSFLAGYAALSFSLFSYYQKRNQIIKYHIIFILAILFGVANQIIDIFLKTYVITNIDHFHITKLFYVPFYFFQSVLAILAGTLCCFFLPKFVHSIIGDTISAKRKVLFRYIGFIFMGNAILFLFINPQAFIFLVTPIIPTYLEHVVYALCISIVIFYVIFILYRNLHNIENTTLHTVCKLFIRINLVFLVMAAISSLWFFSNVETFQLLLRGIFAFYLLVINIINSVFMYKYLHEYFKKPAQSTLNEMKIPHTFISSFNISNRESDILSLLIKGYTNTKMSNELHISIKTVESHLYRIYQKCKVKNRIGLLNLISTNTG